MQHQRANDIAFSAYNADNEDYYAFLPSDESISGDENTPESSIAAKTHDSVEELTSVFASESSIGSSSKVLTLIGSLNGSKPTHKDTKKTRQEEVEAVARGVFNLGGGETLKVSPQTLELYDARKMQLQNALDAATGEKRNGEAPFRFAMQDKKLVKVAEEMKVEGSSASPAPMVDRVEGHAPEKNNLGRRRPVTERKEGDEEEEEEVVDPDVLYDEQLDDVDEQWVQTNFRRAHATKSETDAMLCCPCCFVTLCMACERHATYTNQYRATAAINCRVKRSEILTYALSESSRLLASLPFHKRQNLNTGNDHKTSSTTPGQQIASLLQADEYYSVACSDCGTIVGVFDRDQQYHFFNALPSNC